MASRLAIKGWIWQMLGTSSDDPMFQLTLLDDAIQQGYDSLVADIMKENPSYFSTSVTLAADSGTSHNYTFASQSSPITDFNQWLEVRYNNQDGANLFDCRREELRDFGSDYFTIIGPDDTPTLVTSRDTVAGVPLYLLYTYQPAALVDNTSVPSAIPSRYHDVVALEMVNTVYGWGAEQRVSPELRERWINRRGQLMAHVGKRGTQPSRTRILQDWDD